MPRYLKVHGLRANGKNGQHEAYSTDLEISNGEPIQDGWPTDLATKAVRTPNDIFFANSFSPSIICLFSGVSLQQRKMYEYYFHSSPCAENF